MENEHNMDLYPNLLWILIIIVITFFAVLVGGAIGVLIGARTELFLLEAVIIIPAFIFAVANKYSLVQIFRLRKVSVQVIVLSIIIGIALAIVSDEIDRIVQIFFPMPEYLQNALAAALKMETISDFVIIIFSTVVIAAVVEEMLFRGFIQTSLEHHSDVTKAVMSTAVLFVVFHFNPWWSIQMMIIAIILGVLAWKSDSIIPTIIMHGVNNSMALVFSNIKPENLDWYLSKNHVKIPILILAIVTTIWGIQLFYRACDKSFENQDLPSFDGGDEFD